MTELLRPIGILEMVRTGVVTMSRGDQVLAPPDFYFATNGNQVERLPPERALIFPHSTEETNCG